jgi:hypothetical protein
LLHDQWVIKEIRVKIKTFLKFNENENTAYENLWDTANAELRGMFIVLSVYIKNTERFLINDLILHLRLLEIQDQAKNQN